MQVLKLESGARVRLQLWDIADQERFTWMTRGNIAVLFILKAEYSVQFTTGRAAAALS